MTVKANIIALTLLALLPPGALLLARYAALPRWALMWLLVLALFGVFKWLTFSSAARELRLSPSRSLGYLLGWCGMDAAAFLDHQRSPSPPRGRDWVRPGLWIVIGAALLWLIARHLQPLSTTATAWAGMLGVVLLLHFGLLEWLALAWQRAGVDAIPLMRRPLSSRSLGELWGRRWNTGFRDLAHRWIFSPVQRLAGGPIATLAVFAFSGIVHDVVISIPAGGGYGLPTLYFLVQGAGVLLERTPIGRRFRGRITTLLVAAAPLPLLFHPPFVHNVIVPFLTAIGAT